MSDTVALRLVVERPPAGVTWRMQRGRDALVAPVRESPDALAFALTLRVADGPDGAPTLRGPEAQGPPASRFVYLNSGTYALQAGTRWSRRAKVPLAGIPPALLARARATPGAVLEARIAGTGRDGGPACASVPLLGDGWRLVPLAPLAPDDPA